MKPRKRPPGLFTQEPWLPESPLGCSRFQRKDEEEPGWELDIQNSMSVDPNTITG